MGSLMAGWESLEDPKTVKLQRNRSLTNEGIKSYWRSKKKNEEEQMLASPKLAHQDQEMRGEESEKTYKRSSSMSLPSSNTKETNCVESEEKSEKLRKINGWWFTSDWAFLNEPPVLSTEAPTHKYASQNHVASSHTNDSNLKSTSIGINH